MMVEGREGEGVTAAPSHPLYGAWDRAACAMKVAREACAGLAARAARAGYANSACSAGGASGSSAGENPPRDQRRAPQENITASSAGGISSASGACGACGASVHACAHTGTRTHFAGPQFPKITGL